MKQKVTLSEKQLKDMIMKAIIAEGVDENWFSRNFSLSATGRGSAQLDDAKKVIAKAQECFAAPDADTLEDGFNYLGDTANYLMRAKQNGLPPELMNPVIQTYLQAIDTAKQTITNTFVGQEQAQNTAAGAQNGQIAQDWATAEKEINTVVKGNFSGWPQKCAQAGWPQEKINAYRQLANQTLGKKKQTQAPAAQTAQAPAQQAPAPAAQTAQAQAPAAPSAPAQQQNGQQKQVAESTDKPSKETLDEAIDRILDKYMK